MDSRLEHSGMTKIVCVISTSQRTVINFSNRIRIYAQNISPAHYKIIDINNHLQLKNHKVT